MSLQLVARPFEDEKVCKFHFGLYLDISLTDGVVFSFWKLWITSMRKFLCHLFQDTHGSLRLSQKAGRGIRVTANAVYLSLPSGNWFPNAVYIKKLLNTD